MPSFRSDNNAPICPEALGAIRDASGGAPASQSGSIGSHVRGYGDDPFTARAVASFQSLFGASTEVFFVATGTAANCLAISALTSGRPWSRVLCHAFSHYNEDESTAPELLTACRTTTITPASAASGSQPLSPGRGEDVDAKHRQVRGADPSSPLEGEDVRAQRGQVRGAPIPSSKLTPDDIRRAAAPGGRNDVHQPAPGVLTLSNPTEFGEVYSPAEMRALCDVAHSLGYLVHVDGARFANAVASFVTWAHDSPERARSASDGSEQPLSPIGGEDVAKRQERGSAIARALSIDAGVDALSFGGTKNGLAFGEAVLFFPRSADSPVARGAHAFPFLRKRAGHLLSKHRFVAAPFGAMLDSGAWLAHAAHANSLALRLDRGLRAARLPIPFPVQTNAVFARITPQLEDTLRARGHEFYMFGDPSWRIARLMCSFDTAEADVDALIADATL